MTGILTKGGNLDVDTVMTPCEEEHRNGSDTSTSERTTGIVVLSANHQKLRETVLRRN